MAKSNGKLSTTPPGAAREALEQARAYESVLESTVLELNDGTTIEIPPHPDMGLLDDERLDDYEQLLFERDTDYDREPDIYYPEQKLRDEDGNFTGAVLPAETKRGALKVPYRINGERLKPGWSIRVVTAALGETEYKRLREGGKSAKDVWAIWQKKNLEVARRSARSQADGSPVALVPVPEADSQ
jgi:hypothetical protein